MEGADFAGKEVVVVFPVTYYFMLSDDTWGEYGFICGLGRLVGKLWTVYLWTMCCGH